MDFLTDRIKPIYFKYLSASFGTAMIASIYSIVDVAMVGQYQGPEGTAALAVVAPAWNIIYSLGLLMGAGGSVLFSIRRGGETGDGSENQYFSAALIGAVVLAVPAWVGIIFFDRPILTFFGADSSLLVLAQAYMRPIKYVFPLYLFNQVVAAFSIFSAITSSFSPAFFFVLEKAVKGVGNAVIPTFPMHRSHGLQHLRHKRLTFASADKSGYTLGFRRRIAHSGLHAETGAVSDGGAITTLGAFHTFRKPCVAGV